MNTINGTVELQRYRQEFHKLLMEFELPKEQAQFTGFPTDMLDKVTNGQYPIVILSDIEPVGFFLLHSTERVKEYTENSNAMLLTALSINHSKQGKGFAKKAMSQLKDFISQEFPECNEIILAVNHKNVSAQNLYGKVGFNDTGRRKAGKIGEQLILNALFN